MFFYPLRYTPSTSQLLFVCVMYMRGSMEAREKLGPLELALQVVVISLKWVWETNLNPLEKQLALTRAVTPGPCVLIALH